jgi:hypothetical protein
MSATVQTIYGWVTETLLEPSGFTLGLITPAQFLEYYSAATSDFLGRSGLYRCIALMPQQFGIPQYTTPDFCSTPEMAFSDGVALRRDFEGNISSIDRNYFNKVGTPRSWRQDKQQMNQLSLFPSPNVESTLAPSAPPPGVYGAVLAWAPGQSESGIEAYIGTMLQSGGTATFTTPGEFFGAQPLNTFARGNVAVIGPVGLLTEDVTLSSPVEALTSDWLHFIKYRILEMIWMSDSELKDVQRARYAHARYEEGVMLASAVMGEAIEAE